MHTTSILQLCPTAALSAYGLYLAYQNITRLQQYEQKSEKAAEWSNTAAQKLHKTRTTQATGTLALISSLTCSMLVLVPSFSSTRVLIGAGVGNSVAAYLAYVHMAGYWNEQTQTRIPFVQGFNEAIRGSEQVVVLLKTLSLAWSVASAVWVGMANGASGLLGLAVWGLVVGGRVMVVAPQMGWKTRA
ncbi:hypothetical protein ACJQWK_07971 [Exserohilum turcicum]